MSKQKKNVTFWGIIAMLSFVLLAIRPYFSNVITNLIFQNSGLETVKSFLLTIFNLSSITNFTACLILGIGILTKFDKITTAVGAILIWLSSFFGLIANIFNSFNYNNSVAALTIIKTSFTLFIYFLIVAVAVWHTIIFFTKKATPTFAKFAMLIPVAFLGISSFIGFITNSANIITILFSDNELSNYQLYSVFSLSNSIFASSLFFVGFLAIALKFADLKKKPKNTVEINE